MEDILTTERLVLRPIEDKDKDDIIRGVSDFAVAKWLSMVPHPYTGADAQWFIDHVKASSNGYWAITRAGQFLGIISIKPDLGYWLAPAHWGQGVISEAASAVVAAYFENPAAGPLMSGYFIENARSAAVLYKLGFAHKGPVEEEYSKSLGRKTLHRKVALTPEQWHFLNPVEIKTERLRIRPVMPADAEALYPIAAQKEVARMLSGVPHPLELSHLEKRYEKDRWRGKIGTIFAIEQSENVIGVFGFFYDLVSIGYFIDPKLWGHGYATETVRAMVDFIFERFQCAEITADHFNDNPASGRVLEKAGFKVTGQGEATSKARAAAAPNTLYALKRPDWAKGQRSKLGGDPQSI